MADFGRLNSYRMSITPADGVAAIAVLVASLAALYARWAAREAKRANRLALQARREEIYKNLLEFEDLFRPLLASPSADEVDKFHRNVVVPSKFYFSRSVSTQIDSFWSNAWDLSRLVMALEGSEERNHKEQLSKARDAYHKLREAIQPFRKAMERELHVADA